ncbi:N5-glutamine methyltransferase family protein [Rhizobium sp.]
MDLDLLVVPNVLTPREETELLASTAVAMLAASGETPSIVIDMCCGCGNLAVALAVHVPGCRVWAADISVAATAVALENADRHAVGSRVTVRRGDLFGALAQDELSGKVDMVVCNPPYISSGKLDGDSAALLRDEPREAFDGGPFGLSIHQRVIREAHAFLKPGGLILCEFGEGQARQIETLFARSKAYCAVEFVRDGEGRERVAVARRLAAAGEAASA